MSQEASELGLLTWLLSHLSLNAETETATGPGAMDL